MMDPQLLQAAERVLAWCRAQVWQSAMLQDGGTAASDTESGWPPSDADESNEIDGVGESRTMPS